MKTQTTLLLALFVLLTPLQAEELPLPVWEESDWEKVQSGELVPGSSLVGEIAKRQLFPELSADEALAEGPSEPEPPDEEFPTTIATEFASAYFKTRPDSYLIDPQSLLTMQEGRDREGFLQYHAKDSSIALFFYIFDAKQELPPGESADSLAARFFPHDEKVAVITYFMGFPERTQIGFSPAVKSQIPPAAREKALRLAMEEALEKSDPTSQLESCSLQLSIRLYWIEQELEKARLTPPDLTSHTEPAQKEAPRFAVTKIILQVLSVTGFCVLAGLLGMIGYRLAERRQRYLFPEFDEPPRFHAPHAAGIGGIISYRSTALPPSMQKEESPDYFS